MVLSTGRHAAARPAASSLHDTKEPSNIEARKRGRGKGVVWGKVWSCASPLPLEDVGVCGSVCRCVGVCRCVCVCVCVSLTMHGVPQHSRRSQVWGSTKTLSGEEESRG